MGEEVEEPVPIPSPTPPREGLGEREGVSEKVWVWTCVTLPNSVGEGPWGVAVGGPGDAEPPSPFGVLVGGVALGEACPAVAVGASCVAVGLAVSPPAPPPPAIGEKDPPTTDVGVA